VFVVVGLVFGVSVLPVEVVQVIEVRDGFMAAVRPVHVHMRGMRQMLVACRFITVGQCVHVIRTRPMDMAVVQEIDVVVVSDRWVSAPAIMLVIVAFDRGVRGHLPRPR